MKGKKNLTFKQFMGKESVAGVVFCSPFIIGFLMFMIVPMGISLYYSFCDYNILTPAVFSGAKNYIKMFTDDEVWRKSIQVTFYFALVSVPLRLIFALIVAMLLQPGNADDQWFPGIHPVLHHHGRRSDEFHPVLYGLYVSAVL